MLEEKNIKTFEEELYVDFLNLCDEKTLISICEQAPYDIAYIKKPTKKVQKAAVNRDISSLKYIENPIELIQIFTIKKNTNYFTYIQNPSEKIKKIAVELDPYQIMYIKNPSEEIQLKILKNLSINLANLIVNNHLDAITNKIVLIKLYQTVSNNVLKERIKKSPYWKDDANLILEVINE